MIGSRWIALLAGRRPAETVAVTAPPAPAHDKAMVALLLPAIYATLTTTPRPFVEIATALVPASHDQIRAGLLELQASGLAALEHGFGWCRPATNIEELAESEPCEVSRSHPCTRDGSGRTPTATYSAGRYCTPCLIRYYLDADRENLENGFGR